VTLTSGPAVPVRQAAALLCERDPGHPVRVAVDGVTASGKDLARPRLLALPGNR
jgi:hypothetical protein